MEKEDTQDSGGDVVRPEATRQAFIATSPVVLMIACCTLIANVVGINMLDNRLRDLRSEQSTQPSEINNKIRELDDKIQMLLGQLYRVERMAIEVTTENRPATSCGNTTRRRTPNAPLQENVDDGGK